MTPAEQVVEALLGGDTRALRALVDDPEAGAVARAALVRLVPDDELSSDELALLRTVSGHPGLSAAELTKLVGPSFPAAAARLLELGLVTSSRFARSDCWSRTARGAQVLARLR